MLIGIIIATVAAIIASQALISVPLPLSLKQCVNLWPKMKIIYPTEEKGQLFIPGINLLFIGCVGIVLYFQNLIQYGSGLWPRHHYVHD